VKARFMRAAKIHRLFNDVENNLWFYRFGDFADLLDDSANYFEGNLEIDECALEKITCSKDNSNEVTCCMWAFDAMGTISPYLARDERLWVHLSHGPLLAYARTRWPIPEEDDAAVRHIKTHFFCQGARGIERDNAASRLWWMASLCNRTKSISLEDALICFLHQSDVRANIVERPTTSQCIMVFSAVLQKLHESYNSDKALFNRERFRSFMKGLNLQGGVKLLEVLPEDHIVNILEECIAQAG
jgi:hypothetical protein